MQQFAKVMIEHNTAGSIVNLASIVGKTGNMGQANYASSKSGIESMTRVASKEFGKFNIRVNAVLPGFVTSPMTDIVPDKLKQVIIQACAMKRFGKPEGRFKILFAGGSFPILNGFFFSSEIAEVIAFLASDRSSFVNGASIEVTGG